MSPRRMGMDTDTTPAPVTSMDAAVAKAVLFVDVVASTDYAREHGDEQWRTAIDRHARAVRAIVERHHGMVGSFTGDGFMALFDDPGDALQCGLRMHTANAVQQLFDVRIGIEYGEVLPYGPGWYVGLTLHIASRLTDLSGAGEITLSHGCLLLAQRTTAVPPTHRREVAVRGLDRPLSVHTVTCDHRA